MNVKSLILATLASSTLAACGAADHVTSEINKAKVAGELAGSWKSDCDQKNPLWSVAGVKSQQTVFDFGTEGGKTIKLFSDNACQTELGQVAYKGDITVGANSGAQGSTLLDLVYKKVEVTISNETLVKALNLPVTPGCGINNWVAGQGRDVTTAAGSPTCPVEKATPVYDIAKVDGQTLHFGRTDTAHNGATSDARPVEVDTAVTFKK